jgi:ribosome-associated translation inhibitor RaiA
VGKQFQRNETEPQRIQRAKPSTGTEIMVRLTNGAFRTSLTVTFNPTTKTTSAIEIELVLNKIEKQKITKLKRKRKRKKTIWQARRGPCTFRNGVSNRSVLYSEDTPPLSRSTA